MRTALLLLSLACSTATAHAERFTGKVIAVLDGDTVMVTRKGDPPVKVRLADIDAPEMAQPGGMASKQSLAELVSRKWVSVDSKAVDSYGRLVAYIEADGKNINGEQVRSGMAWEYSRFRDNQELKVLQSEARQARRGLWAGDGIMEPAQWRKLHPRVSSDAEPSPESALQPDSGQACAKRYCSEMSSCDEAKHYLTQCGVKTLDGDRDGIPCEKLCANQKKTGETPIKSSVRGDPVEP